MVHFWNTGAIAAKLGRGEIGERDAFLYFVANSVLWTVNLYYGVLVGARYGWLLFYELLVVLAITVFGLCKGFEANGGSDGSHFVLRATCLSLPLGIKVSLLSFASGWGIYYIFPTVVDPMSFRDPTRVYQLFAFLLAAGITGFFYWRLWLHLSFVRQYASNPQLSGRRGGDAGAG
jgi:hypothetical protein